jgi:hypothetical protein
VARLAHYEPLEKTVEITAKTTSLEVGLRALPGVLTLRPETPKTRVSVERVNRKSWEPPYQQIVEFGWSEEQVVQGVAAGDLRLAISRDGFRSREIDVRLAPEGKEHVVLPALEPILGVLVVKDCAVPGARVKVTDDDGVVIFEGEIGASGGIRAEMRIGTHSLEVSHENYAPHKDEVRISENSPLVLERLTLTGKTGDIVVTGPPGALVKLFVKGHEDVAVDQGVIPPEGPCEMPSKQAGDYVVVLKPQDGAERKIDIKVLPGRSTPADFPK